jgi:hypothetical protein
MKERARAGRLASRGKNIDEVGTLNDELKAVRCQ